MNKLIEINNPIGAINPELTKKGIEKGKQLASRFLKDKQFRDKVINVASKIKKGKKVEKTATQLQKTATQCKPKLKTDEQTGIDVPITKGSKGSNTITAKEGDTIKILTGSDAGKTAIVTSVKGENKFTITELTQ
jgi:hypothetical protein